MKKLSIIILNYNTEDLLKQCLSSIPKDIGYQIIVVDNASADNSVDMVKKDFPRVELIRNKENLGYTKGNNAAKHQATGDYVLFLNSDTKMFPDTLPKMLKLMDQDPGIGISTPSVKLPNGKPYYASHRGFPSPWNSFTYFLGLAKLFPKIAIFSGYTATHLPLNTLHEIDACSGTFLLIRKKILDAIGWFDESYFAYGDDLQMCFDTKKLGYKIVYNPNAHLLHYWGASSGLTKTSKKAPDPVWSKARYQAMKTFYDKNYKTSYPNIVRSLIFFAIDQMSKIRRFSD